MTKKFTIEIEKENLRPRYSPASSTVSGKKVDKTKIEELIVIIRENAKLEREERSNENIRNLRHV